MMVCSLYSPIARKYSANPHAIISAPMTARPAKPTSGRTSNGSMPTENIGKSGTRSTNSESLRISGLPKQHSEAVQRSRHHNSIKLNCSAPFFRSLWVRLGSRATQSRLPLFPQQPTLLSPAVTSEKCQQRTIHEDGGEAVHRTNR